MKAIVCFALCAVQLLSGFALAEDAALRLPKGLLAIEDEAFMGDASLVGVILPASVTHIGAKAFAFSAIRHIFLPDSVEFIADDAFEGCSLDYATIQGDYCRKWCADHGIKACEPDPNETEIFTDF